MDKRQMYHICVSVTAKSTRKKQRRERKTETDQLYGVFILETLYAKAEDEFVEVVIVDQSVDNSVGRHTLFGENFPVCFERDPRAVEL